MAKKVESLLSDYKEFNLYRIGLIFTFLQNYSFKVFHFLHFNKSTYSCS